MTRDHPWPAVLLPAAPALLELDHGGHGVDASRTEVLRCVFANFFTLRAQAARGCRLW